LSGAITILGCPVQRAEEAVLAAAVVLTAAAPAMPATAQDPGSYIIYEFVYYSDATRSSVVGAARQGCYPGDPTMSQWGSVTEYFDAHPIATYYSDGTCIYI
jgi:hypothetical protein